MRHGEPGLDERAEPRNDRSIVPARARRRYPGRKISGKCHEIAEKWRDPRPWWVRITAMRHENETRHVAPWNLVVQTRSGAASSGLFECLSDFGRVRPAEQPGVYLLHAHDPVATLRQLRLLRRMMPAVDRAIERIVPLTETFTFASEQELVARANRYIEQWRPRLAGHSVHLEPAQDAATPECRDMTLLSGILASLLDKAGLSDAADPDLCISFDCCGDWAGLSLWSRALRRRYPELGLDTAEASMA